MQIGELYRHLIETARQRVRAGEVTERGLARQCGISQPHMHNILKNLRSLSPESADRLMGVLDLRLPEFTGRIPVLDGRIRMVPLVKSRIGPGFEATLTVFRGALPFDEETAGEPADPVVAQLAGDLIMPACLRANDFVLLDRNAKPDSRGGIWIVSESAGLRVRYLRRRRARLYLANEATIGDPSGWEPIAGDAMIQSVLKGRIVWMGRNLVSE
jgi:hypothetical protein